MKPMLTDGLKIIIKKNYVAYNAALLSFTVLWRFYESVQGLLEILFVYVAVLSHL